MTAREKFLRARLAIWEARRDRAKREIAKKRRQIEALPQPAKGIDVSVFQGIVDWKRVKAAGYDFAWVKATEGQDFRDSNFIRNVAGARAAGLKVGAYHFLRPKPGRPAEAEMEDFHAALVVAKLGRGDLRPVIDCERTQLSPEATRAYARRALIDIKHRTGIRPMFYTFPFFNEGVWPGDFNNLAMLWIAHYASGPGVPKVVKPWSKYHAWQMTSEGRVPGVAGDCDINTTPDLKLLVA